MRASEFITETAGEFDEWHQKAMPGMKSLPTTDQYYEIYRFGVAMAGIGRPNDPVLGAPDGPVSDNPTVMGYSTVDDDIIDRTLAFMGSRARQITTTRSEEPSDTHTISPMQPRGPVKRKL